MKRLLAVLIMPALIVAACGGQDKPESKAQNESERAGTDNGPGGLRSDPKPERNTDVVAIVNGIAIYKDELKGRPVKDLISEEVIYQKGLGMGLEDKYTQKLRDYRKQLIVNDIRSDILDGLPPSKEVSDEEIQGYYNNNPLKYNFVRMHEIGFSDEGLGEEILTKVKSGEDPAEIANSYSESGANVLSRDLGYSREMLKHFNDVEVGAVTEIITKPNGSYSVIKIIEIKPIPLRQSERAIRRLLEAKRKTAAYNDYADQIVEESGIEIEIVGK